MAKQDVIAAYIAGVKAVPDDKYCKRLEDRLGVSGICGALADKHWKEFKSNVDKYAEKWYERLVKGLTRKEEKS